jgi:hypothetical protein
VPSRPSSAGSLRIVVLGYVVRGPLGGMSWSDLHYLLGLRDLGHDVWFLEDSDDYPSCSDPVAKTIGTDPSYGLRFASELFSRTGLGDRWAYHDAHTRTWHGPGSDAVRGACRDADVLLDLAGVNPLRPWLEEIPHRVLVDKDPVFTQFRHLADPSARARAAAHTAFFTFGENVAALPDDGFPWRATRHPIWVEGWPLAPAPRDGRFTTVLQWESYAAAEHDGLRYGRKAESFAPFLSLPERLGRRFELVVGGPNVPRDLLESSGWIVRDPLEVVADAWAYRRYVQGSRGELTVAKEGYVTARCGWFSERSASYLATGRPVVTQETGFSDVLPNGLGLLAFSTLEEAVAAVESVDREYTPHCHAARELALAHFDARPVLASLLERATSPAAAQAAGAR